MLIVWVSFVVLFDFGFWCLYIVFVFMSSYFSVFEFWIFLVFVF